MRQLLKLHFRSCRASGLRLRHNLLLPTARPSQLHTQPSRSQNLSVRAMTSETLTPPFPKQRQPGTEPGSESKMDPKPDFGEQSYKGSGKLKGKVSLVTGADSGIGRAIALAFAREGSDVAISYWKEHEDAEETARWIEKAGQKAILLPGDLAEEETCQGLREEVSSVLRKHVAQDAKSFGKVFDETLKQLGKVDILVNNASQQEEALETFTKIPRERLIRTFHVNLIAMFCLAQRVAKICETDILWKLMSLAILAAEHMVERGEGGNIINIASIQAYKPSPGILDYSCTKGAIVTLTKGIALEVAEKGVRVNCIAPGPVWTPLVVSSFPTEKIASLGEGQVPMNRPGQPSEFQGTAVYLASDADSSYVTGAIINVTGGQPHIA